MKKIKLMLLFLSLFMLSSFVLSNDTDIYLKENLDIEMSISNDIDIIKAGSESDIRTLRVFLSYVPKEDTQQKILDMKTSPKADNQNGDIKFEWNNVKDEKVSYSVTSKIRTHNYLKRVSTKVPFPLKSLDSSMNDFLIETESVDYLNPRIKTLANELAAGEDDLYVVLHKFAEWVNDNIEYDLNTQTAEASQKASWVIENGFGVCDELTNLFIALSRSVGVPARFISGIAHTTDERFDNPWNAHGWAEVYFPDYGWIPFDVTYGEFGYIDPTHVKLKESNDANKTSTRYEWESIHSQIQTKQLEIDTKVTSEGEMVKPLVNINSRFAKESIGFESHNILEVEIINKNNIYVPLEIFISKTESLENLDGNKKFVLMEPNSEKTVFFTVKLLPGLENNYIYTFKTSATTNRGAESIAVFTSKKDSPVYSINEIEQYSYDKIQEAEKVYSKEISLECNSNQNAYYVEETAMINCIMKNTGNIQLDNVNLCMEDECQIETIGISEEKNFSFNHQITSKDDNKISFIASNEHIQKTVEATIVVFDHPQLAITEISAPKNVNFNEDFSLEFLVEKENSAPIKKAMISVVSSGIEKNWDIENLEDNRRFILNINKYALAEKENEITITAEYIDTLDREYSIKKRIKISLNEMSMSDKVIFGLNKLGIFAKENTMNVIITIIIATFVAWSIVILITRQRKP